MIGIGLILGACLASADDTPLSLADLPAYQAAIAATRAEPPVAVGFRDLWDHPETYRGRRVEVRGRVVRRFRQPAVGVFPPLMEAWTVNDAGDPFCLVFPSARGATPEVGATVRFAGTYLKRLRYEGGDAPRLAPLIVGGQPPIVVSAPRVGMPSLPGLSHLDWMVGLIVGAVVALILVRQHLGRPSRPRAELGPPPDFLEPDEEG